MTTRKLLMAAATMCLATAPLFAQNDMSKQPPKPTTPSAKTPPGMPSPDEMAKMMEERAKVTANHQLLNSMVGEWTCDVKAWMDPMSPTPIETKGTATNTWVMGNRFVRQDFKGTFAMAPGATEKPYTGMGYTGYDNAKGKYVATWLDTMDTGIMYSEGTYDAGSKTFTFAANCTDPMGQPMALKEIIKVTDDNAHTFTMMAAGPDGKEMKMMEITYHRKGGMKPTDASEKPNMNKPMDTKPSTTPATKPGRGNNPGGG